MLTINATIRNGRVEPDEPLDLPEGTAVQISVPADDTDSDDEVNDNGAMSPEEIARVLAALDRVIPFDRSAEEEAMLEADRIARKEWEKAHFVERSEKIERMLQ